MLDWRNLSSHHQRVATGIALGAPLFLIILLGPSWMWYILTIVLALIGLWEAQGLLFREEISRSWSMFFLSIGLLPLLGAGLGGGLGLHAAVVVIIFSGFLHLLVTSPNDPTRLLRLASSVLGWLYVPYLLAYVILIGQGEGGSTWIFFAIAIVIPNDAGAYYCGRRWGRRKLYEQVSPNKTVEGAAGGLISGTLAGVVYGIFFLQEVTIGSLMLASIVVGLVGQVGDLMESMIKRMAEKKDSSNLLPGHGGILDRLDSLLFAFPAVWFFSMWVGR